MTGHATTPVPAALARLIRRETQRLAREARRARKSEARGVHQARVASRRLREMLAVAGADARVDARVIRRQVRRLTSALGPIRELDVAQAVWHETDDPERWAPKTVAILDHRADRDRRRHVGAMRAALDAVTGGSLVAQLSGVADAVELHAGPRVVAAAIGTRVRRRAQDALRALAGTGTTYAAGPLHNARIALKKLRYAAELAREPGGAGGGRDIGQLKRAQDLLGRIHDLQVVQERVRAAAATARISRATLDALEGSDAAIEIECRQLHGRFVARTTALAAVAERLRDDTAGRLLTTTMTRPVRAGAALTGARQARRPR